MRLELTGRHVTITPAVRKLVEKPLTPTLRMLNDNALSAQVVLTRQKTQLLAEVTLHARGEHFLHGAGRGHDVTVAMGAAMAKIDRQAQKLKGKWESRKRRKAPRPALTEVAVDGSQDVRIIRARRYAVKPLSIDDAALEVGTAPDNFLVFRNLANDTITILFRRSDGHLGLIEPEV
jgi:putative sigma-54 modulation protein